jgi:hypothetical protein
LADLKAKKAPKRFAPGFRAPNYDASNQPVDRDEPLWRTRFEPLREFSLFELRFCLNHARQQRRGAG